MRKRARLILSVLLLLPLLFGVVGNSAHQVYAQEAHIINPNPEIYVLVPGETTTIKVPLKAIGAPIYRPAYLIDTTGTPYTATEPVLRTDGFSKPQDHIYEYIDQYLEFDITVAESAKIGNYSFKINIYGTYVLDMSGETPFSEELTINTRILKEKEQAQLTVNNVTTENAVIGKEMNLSFSVKNEGEITARNVFVSIDYKESGMIADYTTKNIKLVDIAPDQRAWVKLPVRTFPTTEPGIKTITVNLSHKNDQGEVIKESYDLFITLNENEDAPKLFFEDFSYNTEAKQGDKLGLTINIRNSGKTTAYSPRIYVDESSIGPTKYIKDYYTEYIEAKTITADKVVSAEVPLLIAKEAKGGINEITLRLVYFDKQGVEYETKVTIYPSIESEGISEDGKPIVLIGNVKQSPQKPVAGERLDVSFDMENKSAIDLNDLRLNLNLTADKFIPVESDPYIYIGTLRAGTTKRITIPLTVSEHISEGLHYLEIDYTYSGGDDKVNIPVLDVQNDLGSASRPRLIISDFGSDIEELKAGSVFNFNFDIRNTHSSVAAKNIKVTVTGKTPQGGEEIFSVTEGSNIFFISKIGAGETVSESLELKIKSDAATGSYPINIDIEYEYDGIKPDSNGNIGVTEENELTFLVSENARPVVDYIHVYSWDGAVTVGNPATLAFDFYNMGKSTLYNVVATIEGDFMSASNSMYFLSNVEAGGTSYAEFEVIPNVEGMAYGVVKITYEDSLGNEQVYTKEFEASVSGMMPWDPGMNGDGDMDVFNPVVPEPKKPIMATWLFVVMQVVIFVIFLLVSRKIVIEIHKSKLRKKEEEMY